MIIRQYDRIALLTDWVRNLRAGIYKEPMPLSMWRLLTDATATDIVTVCINDDTHWGAILLEAETVIFPLHQPWGHYNDFRDYLWRTAIFGLRTTAIHARRVDSLNFMSRYVRRTHLYGELPRRTFLDMAVRSQDYMYVSRQPGPDNNVIYTVLVPLNNGQCVTHNFSTPHSQWPYDTECFYEFLDCEFDHYDVKTGVSEYGD